MLEFDSIIPEAGLHLRMKRHETNVNQPPGSIHDCEEIEPDTDLDIEPHAAHATCNLSAHQVPSLQTSNEPSDGLEPPLEAKSTEGDVSWHS